MAAAVCTFEVRYSETGAEGFVHHGSYYSWYDMVQNKFLNQVGIPYQTINEAGIRFLPIEMNSRYFAPAYFGDVLTVSMKI